MPATDVVLDFLQWTAVLLNVGFTLCIAWEKRIGWVLGFIAGCIGTGLYLHAHTWAMSVLNVYYILMAVYGWWSWGSSGEERIRTERWTFHAVLIAAGLLTTYALAVLLGKYLNGSFPELDAFVTVFSFIATWMMARKMIANWAWFILADSAAVYLNWRIGYMGYAALNGMYIVLSVIGLVKWGRALVKQHRAALTA